MKQIIFLTLIALCILPTVNSQNVATDKALPHSLPINSVSFDTDGKYNYAKFQVTAPEDGKFYANFWLLPAKYADGTYTNYIVKVNDDYAATIETSKGNWQSAQPNGDGRLYLEKGINTISIGTPSPEYPDVETIKLAEYYAEAVISSDAYDDYQKLAKNNATKVSLSDALRQSKSSLHSISDAVSMPLGYSFYQIKKFRKNYPLFVSSSSVVEHAIDIFFYGKEVSYRSAPVLRDSTLIGPTITVKMKLITDSERMQGYNWKAPAEFSPSTGKYVAKTRIKLPEDGYYFIRLRSKESELLSTADVNINFQSYEDVPIYYSAQPYRVADNGKVYGVSVTGDPDADPIVFIHGNDADRIVGFNDDYDPNQISGLTSETDSYIAQSYHVPTSVVSVASLNSLSPISTCYLNTYIKNDTPVESPQKEEIKNTHSQLFSKSLIDIPGTVSLNSTIRISATEDINTIAFYKINGECLYVEKTSGNCFEKDVTSLNIQEQGIYIVNVETSTDFASQKIYVK